MQDKRMRLLSNIVIAYMLVAFAWWSVLLFVKNRDAFNAKSEYLQIVMVAEGNVDTREEFYKSDIYKSLAKEYERQEWMIFGEATFFIISLILGIWLINRGYRNAMFAAQQRRNFLLSITHELKSPIASIRLAFETIFRRDLDKEKVNMLSTSGIKESDRLNDLVNNLLLAAKVESAYQPVMESLDLNLLFTETIDRLTEKYPSANLSLEFNLNEGEFEGDDFGIRSIVINLIENAIKYSPDPANVELETGIDDNQLFLYIKDEGYGIPPSERKRIFDQFYRIGNEDTRRAKGTGLGLFIVQRVVNAHDGKINVLSNSPKGTRFEIFFPRKRFTERKATISNNKS